MSRFVKDKDATTCFRVFALEKTMAISYGNMGNVFT
jgi:hypothetical protein